MKIIVPMAGRGSRLRPHSLTIPKPLIPIAGKPIVHQLVTEIARVVAQPVSEIAFILGDPAFFGNKVRASLEQLAAELNAKATFFWQLEPLGTGHAVMCAESVMEGPAIIAYADTLIKASLRLDLETDAMIWVKKVQNPEDFGVVQLDDQDLIVNLIEKPKKFISNLAAIGVYYFKDVGILKNELKKVLQKQLQPGEEYQINQGILPMIDKGYIFKKGTVNHWMDCGNPQAALDSNSKMLSFLHSEKHSLITSSVKMKNSAIIPPCYVGEGAVLENSTIGPYVSVGAHTVVCNSTMTNCLIQNHSQIEDANLDSAMIGNHVRYNGKFTQISIGDYSELI